MIHFNFSEQDKRYLYIKYDNKEDEKWLSPSKMKKINSQGKEVKVNHPNLTDHINLVNPICYLPSWGNRPKQTEDFFFKYIQPSGDVVYYCAIGLWQEIYKFLKQHNIPFDGLIENQHLFKHNLKHTFEEFKEIVDSWELSRTPRPYQYEAAYKILQWNQSVSQLATRAGKTLISYIIFRYAKEYLGAHNILMIVPSRDLVKQAYNDFADYAEFFDIETVFGGGHMFETSNLTVGTFQSLIKFLDKTDKKYNPKYFNKFDVVFCDETHRATANQITTIISQPFMKKVKIAFGMTGTLPNEKTIEHYCLHALLGAKIQTITPKQLMDAGYISKIHINQIRLKYNNPNITKYWIKTAEYCLGEYIMEDDPKHPGKKRKKELDNPKFLYKHVKKIPEGILDAKDKIYNKKEKDDSLINDEIKNYNLFGDVVIEKPKKKKLKKKKTKEEEYIDLLKKCVKSANGTNLLVIEKMILHLLDERIDYLCNEILPKCDKNTLILAHHTEYIEYFSKKVKEKFPDKHIDIITGKVSDKKRDKIKQMLKDNNDCILIASYGCMSTGITLSNLCYGVLFESFKSNVINMQSLGRGLGLSEIKDKYIVYDIVDELPGNKILNQGKDKIDIYIENSYPYEIYDITI